ncbi:unnamed protein product, partial [Prorocentrum cordatum]
STPALPPLPASARALTTEHVCSASWPLAWRAARAATTSSRASAPKRPRGSRQMPGVAEWAG